MAPCLMPVDPGVARDGTGRGRRDGGQGQSRGWRRARWLASHGRRVVDPGFLAFLFCSSSSPLCASRRRSLAASRGYDNYRPNAHRGVRKCIFVRATDHIDKANMHTKYEVTRTLIAHSARRRTRLGSMGRVMPHLKCRCTVQSQEWVFAAKGLHESCVFSHL